MTKINQSRKKPAKKVCESPADAKFKNSKLVLQWPSYVCRACDRSAANPESLCQPEKLYSTW